MAEFLLQVPVLETARLRLRGHRQADFAAILAYRAHPDVFRHTTGKPMTEYEAWMRFLARYGQWAVHRYGSWAIEEKATGIFIGEAGFSDARRPYAATRRGMPEAGWWLGAEWHGKGYGIEALRAAHAWSDRHLQMDRTFCGVIRSNTASMRLAKRLGYEEVEEASFNDQATVLLERVVARAPDGPCA